LGHYGNAVIRANVATGKIVWTYRERGFPYFSTPAVTPSRVVIGGRDKRVHGIERATGKGLWTFRTRGKVDSSPVIRRWESRRRFRGRTAVSAPPRGRQGNLVVPDRPPRDEFAPDRQRNGSRRAPTTAAFTPSAPPRS
jgi:outer membrane protein assembly factor BamB